MRIRLLTTNRWSGKRKTNGYHRMTSTCAHIMEDGQNVYLAVNFADKDSNVTPTLLGRLFATCMAGNGVLYGRERCN